MKIGTESDAALINGAEEQTERVAAAVEQGKASGKTDVLIKAEKNVRLRELGRVAAAAAREGVTLHMAVMEKDTAE